MQEMADDQSYDGAQGDSVVEVAPEAEVVTGRAEVETDDPVGATDEFTKAIAEVDGRISNSETTTRSRGVVATVTARVPAEKYEEIVDKLSGYGKVVEETTQSEDVGQELVDLDARIKALETSVDRLEEMLDGSENLSDLLELESTLTERQGDLDSLRGQQRYLEDQVAMSTLTVTFTQHAGTDTPGGPGTFEQAWDAFKSSLSALVIVALGLLPWIVVVGMIAWPFVALVRRRRAGHSRRAQEQNDE